jgi:hypothetical protein
MSTQVATSSRVDGISIAFAVFKRASLSNATLARFSNPDLTGDPYFYGQ